MKQAFPMAALFLAFLSLAGPASADPRDKNSRYLFLKEGNGNIVYVDSNYIKAIPTPNGGLVEYLQIIEFKDKNISPIYKGLKKALKPTEEPVAMFTYTIVDCTLGRYKIRQSSISGYDLTDSTKTMKKLNEYEENLDEIDWTVIAGGLSPEIKNKVCTKAR